MLKLLPSDKSFVYEYTDAEPITYLKPDPYHVIPHNEISKKRVEDLIESISEDKLLNSYNKSVKNKGYSNKELTDMLILLGENTSGLKNSHIAILLAIKRTTR